MLLGTALLLTLIYLHGKQSLTTMQAQAIEANTVATMTETSKAATAVVVAEAAPKQSFVQFVVSASQTGAQRAALLDLVGRYISPDAVISQIDMSDGQTAKITATLKSPNDYARFLLNLRAGSATRGGQLFADDPRSFAVLPTNTLPGNGFTQPFVTPQRTTVPQIVTYPITMTVIGKLKDNIIVPSDPGAASSATSSSSAGGLSRAGGPGGPGAPPVSGQTPPAAAPG